MKIIVTLIITLSFVVIGCKSNKIVYSKYDNSIKDRINNSKNTDDFFTKKDTILLPNNVVNKIDFNAIVLYKNSNLYFFNPLSKNIIILDKKGKIIKLVGQSGEGPGEMRNIVCATVNDSNIYIYDNILSRFTIYDKYGNFEKLISTDILDIRAICADKLGSIYIHHPPQAKYNSFLSIIKRDGRIINIGAYDNGYKSYYIRGFLDGNIICDNNNVFFSNIYDYKISKYDLFRNTYNQFGKKPKDFIKLKKENNLSNFNKLSDNYQKATIVLSLHLIDKSRLLLQELINFPQNIKKRENHRLIFYNKNGLYLGYLKIPPGNLFASSNGDILVQFLYLPPNFNVNSTEPLCKVILYQL